METLPATPPRGSWVQTERAAHEAWSSLIAKSPVAAQVMHILTANLGDHNAVVISQKTIAEMIGRSDRSVRTAIAMLRDENWIEVRQIGLSSTVNAYVVNDRVAWGAKRDGLRYSLFSAAVVVSESEQPDRDSLSMQASLRRVPSLYPGEVHPQGGARGRMEQ